METPPSSPDQVDLARGSQADSVEDFSGAEASPGLPDSPASSSAGLSPDEVFSAGSAEPDESKFQVQLEAFSGPFDLLLTLVAKHRLDITEVALAQVTDEFIAHMTRFPDLSQASEFIVVAATLLDIKAARLLPRPEGDAEEDLEYLEARDLLFSRLLQYRAFKQAASAIESRLQEGQRFIPREVPLEPHFAALLPSLVWAIGPEDLAQIAADVFSQRRTPQVTHLHDPVVPVRQQVQVLVQKLRGLRKATFRKLVEDADSRAMVISRFLALLELFRSGSVAFDQVQALGELTVRWTGNDSGDVEVVDDYDDQIPASEASDSVDSEVSDSAVQEDVENPTTEDKDDE